MKALVKVDYEGLVRVEDIPEPEVGPRQVKIRVEAGGICGTDLHILKNEYKHDPPVVMGHEFAGVITEAGPEVKGYAPGDRVVSLTAAVTCGSCDYCIAGIPMLCSERKSIGSGLNGAFAAYLVIDYKLLYRIPDEVSLEAAAVTEPLACNVHGIMEMSRVSAGDLVLVSGPGTIGLLATQVAQAEGGRLVVCGTPQDADRLRIAKDLGVEHIVDISQQNIVEFIHDLTDGQGADVVIECSGVEASAHNCLQAVRGRGRYIQMGLFGKPITVDMDRLAYREISYSSSFATTPSSFKTSLKLLAQGKVRTEPLISARLPLEEWQKGFEMLEKKQGLKVLLIP